MDAREDDLSQISEWHLDVLSLMLRQPARYTQRVVESLSFLPGGGQQWNRSLQIRFPHTPIPSEHPEELASHPNRYVVSVGMFERRRFPDFVVRDAHGNRLNLLTRSQHGYCLANGMIRGLLTPREWELLEPKEVTWLLVPLYNDLVAMLTSVDAKRDPPGEDLYRHLGALLAALGADPLRIDAVSQMLETAYDQLAHQTQYLCWVNGRPGETVQLDVHHTMADVPSLSGPASKSQVPLPSGKLRREARAVVLKLRDIRMRRYAAVGLRPLYYAVRAPSHDHAGSYYFVVTPPARSTVTLLDWGRQRCFAKRYESIDSAAYTCHIHNGEGTSSRTTIDGSIISLFVRAEPSDHGTLAAVAVLNLVLAFLAQQGSLLNTSRGGYSQWLLLTPALIAVFIGLQRSHHYGPFMRPLRIAMWAYAALSTMLAASVSFDFAEGRWLGREGIFDDLTSAAVALSSAGLVVLLAASGPLYERATTRAFRRVFGRSRAYPGAWSRVQRIRRYPWQWPDMREKQRRWEVDSPDDGTRSYPSASMYTYVGRKYADRLLMFLAIVLLLLAGGMTRFWGNERADRVAQGLTSDRACLNARGVTSPQQLLPAIKACVALGR